MKLDEKNNRVGDTVEHDFGSSVGDSASQATTEQEFFAPVAASRARNRTVMLSPDVTGQVRSLLQNPIPNAQSLLENSFQKPSDLPSKSEDGDKSRGRKVTGSCTLTGSSKNASTNTRLHRVSLMEDLIQDDGTLSVGLNSLGGEKYNDNGTLEVGRMQNREEGNETCIEELGTRISQNTKNFLNQTLKDPELSESGVKSSVFEEMNKVPLVKKEIKSKIIGFLVSYDNIEFGEVTELRAGRWLISSRPSNQEDVLVFEDNSISALHAVVKVSESGVIQVMDQLSDRGSGVFKIESGKEIDASETAVKVQHGDLVRFGNRYFVYCAIPKVQIEN